jgi:ribosomal protein S18 acetylase RimI-like enzyme
MELIKALPNDVSALQSICREAYAKVFADHWTENGMDLYLEQEFGSNRLVAELEGSDFAYFFIKEEGEAVGFLKMKYRSSPELSEERNCELEKIYILPKYSGKGIGKMAMSKVIAHAKKSGINLLFLCVIDTNTNAIAFYEKLGFESHSKTRLEIPLFREELRGMNRLMLRLK